MKLFLDAGTRHGQHPIYEMLKSEEHEPERAVLTRWAEGFVDRDNKFVHEFETSFEPCLWELYLHACLKELDLPIDFSFSRPDFCVIGKHKLCMEATIAAPPAGGQAPYGFKAVKAPSNLNRFNAHAAVRICNSFSGKERKYRESYGGLSHVQGKPYVIAIASYDQPFSHMAANRPIFGALYGLYYDEEQTIERALPEVLRRGVVSVVKNAATDIPVGLFLDDTYRHVSAVVYSSLATWGKVRALADSPGSLSVYTSIHPNDGSLRPVVRQAMKKDYSEDLLDGLYILHNPFATNPLDLEVFNHPRVAQVHVNSADELEVCAPDDFLLMRFLMSMKAMT